MKTQTLVLSLNPLSVNLGKKVLEHYQEVPEKAGALFYLVLIALLVSSLIFAFQKI